jgi:hypothetical protein
MAYATVDELADALRVAVTAKNSDRLAKALDAAAEVCDHILARPATSTPYDIATAPALLRQQNLSLGVEMFKASDAAFGVLGFADVGGTHVSRDVYDRHVAALIPLVETFGLA